jgi:phi13 family phage major tail protein
MLVGFDSAKIGVMTDGAETFATANTFVLDAANGGRTQTAQIQNLSASTQTVYGSNAPRVIRGRGAGAVSLSLTTENIDADKLAQITGSVKTNGIYTIDSDTVAPYCAIELISSDGDKPVHLALLKGVFSFPDQKVDTNNANVQENYDTITFTAEARMSDNKIFAKAFEADQDFLQTAWDALVFPPDVAP